VEQLGQLYEGLSLEPEVWKQDACKRDPYRVLILMGLSAGGVADQQLTNPCQQLFALCPDPSQFIMVWENESSKITSIVKQLNWWGKKIEFVKSAVSLLQRHGGVVPQDRTLLRQFIGEITTEKVVCYGYGKPALPVDSNVCRVVFRICGLRFEYGPSQYAPYVRDNLEKLFQPDEWIWVHELLRLHGQAVCRKVPRCSLCNVTSCHSRSAKYVGCGDAAKEAARKVVATWQDWRQLILKPEKAAC
jgi:endonuclease III